LAAGALGCGPHVDLDTRAAERQIAAEIKRAYGVRTRSVKCPDRVEARKGEVFRCTAVLQDRSSLRVKVSEVDDDGTVNIDLPRL
jgi:Domain of unknown function (DUF4333)